MDWYELMIIMIDIIEFELISRLFDYCDGDGVEMLN